MLIFFFCHNLYLGEKTYFFISAVLSIALNSKWYSEILSDVQA